MRQRAIRFACLATAALTACAEIPSFSVQDDAVQTFSIAAKSVPCPNKDERRCLVVNGAAFSSNIAGYTHTEGKATVIMVARTHRGTLQQTGVNSYNYRIVSKSDAN